ncbi:rho-N domain-containing protein 1, chloroplastic-like, partial [Carica papaya]
PASNFQRRSPVPQSRYQSVYSSESALNTVSYSNTSVRRKKNQVETHREPTYKPVADPQPEVALGLESEPEAEPEPELEPESIYQDEDIAVAVPDIVSSDFGDGDNDEDEDEKEEHRIEDGDLNALKLPELRALAKSRGAKGFSKMKKSELVDLLSATSV